MSENTKKEAVKNPKSVKLKITTFKSATTNDDIRKMLAAGGNASIEYISGGVKLIPNAQKKRLNDAVRIITDELKKYMGSGLITQGVKGELVLRDGSREDDIKKVLDDALVSAKEIFKGVRETYSTWIEEVKSGIGDFAQYVQLPQPGAIDVEMELSFGDMTECDLYDREGKDINQEMKSKMNAAKLALKQEESYDAALTAVLKNIKSFNGKGDPMKALSVKTGVADLAKIGILDPEAATKVNELVSKILEITASGRQTLDKGAVKDELTAEASKILAGASKTGKKPADDDTPPAATKPLKEVL